MPSIIHILEIQRKKSPPTPIHTTGGDREVNRGEAPDRGEHRERDPRGCGSTERIKAAGRLQQASQRRRYLKGTLKSEQELGKQTLCVLGVGKSVAGRARGRSEGKR